MKNKGTSSIKKNADKANLPSEKIKIKKYTKNEDKSPTVRIDFCILSENL